MAVLVTVLLAVSIVPLVMPAGAQDSAGYLVFRDRLPVGPGLDAEFHVVIPDGVAIESADLHLYGTSGDLPFQVPEAVAGVHDHVLLDAGSHSHVASLSGDHNHTVSPSGEHDHTLAVYGTNFRLDDEKMTVDMPTHTHTFNGFSRVVDPYDFPAVTSVGHNHTAPPHGHATVMTLSGEHVHVTDEAGNHTHDLGPSGAHQHVSDVAGLHSHELEPGFTDLPEGSRPSDVRVRLRVGGPPQNLPGRYGNPGIDWYETVDMSADIGTGLTEVTLSSATAGMLEYVLVVGLGMAYTAATGSAVIGPGGTLQLPLMSSPGTLSAQLYLFGGDLPAWATETEIGGNHTHVADPAGEHVHTTGVAGDHGHLVTGGDHEHDVTVANRSAITMQSAPVWNLPSHRHDVTWQGNVVTGLSVESYGRVQSMDHNHTVISHDHQVTIAVSGNHTHNLSDQGSHLHTVSVAADHSHTTSEAAPHSHDIDFSPSSSPIGAPTDVALALDGVDITDANGGPWDLGSDPVVLDLDVPTWDYVHTLNLTAGSEGTVEWVVLYELTVPAIIASMWSPHGMEGVHVPVPARAEGATVGVLGSTYVMPMDNATMAGGEHTHTTAMEGEHEHVTDPAGDHTHDLAESTHLHNIVLEDTIIIVDNATGQVDFGMHSHTIQLGAFQTSSATVGGVTGSHSHTTQPHTHNVSYQSSSDHTHVCELTGDHSHTVQANGSHSHTVSGGEHRHTLRAGVTHFPSMDAARDVSIALGAGDPGRVLPGDDSTWWEMFQVPKEAFASQELADLVVRAEGSVGSIHVTVMFLMDFEPPALTLVEAPDWVAPGDVFNITMMVPDDLDPDTVVLEVGPMQVLEGSYEEGSLFYEFMLEVPTDAPEALYDINVTAADVAGNSATVIIGQIGVDRTPPVLSVSIGEPRHITVDTTWVTSFSPIALTLEDQLSGQGSLEYSLSTGGTWTAYDPETPTLLEGLPSGPVELSYRGTDLAGNEAEVRTISLTVDDDAPGIHVSVTPSAPTGTDSVLAVGPTSFLYMEGDDGDGVGVDLIEYRIVSTAGTGWRAFDQPIRLRDYIDSPSESLEVEMRAWDLLGNSDDDPPETIGFQYDPVSPVPSPLGDLFFDKYTTESHMDISGRVPVADVAAIHYRMESGSTGRQPIDPDTTFNFTVSLLEGPNVLLYALEDWVGNISPWVVGGTVVRDNTQPAMASVVPSDGSEDLPTGLIAIGLHFTEPVSLHDLQVKADGKDVAFTLSMMAQNTSATVQIEEDLEEEVPLTLRCTMVDNAGNSADLDLRWRTRASEDGASMGFIYGLIAGFVLGLIVLYMATFRRRGEVVPLMDESPLPGSIITPEERAQWAEEEDGDAEDEEDEAYGDDEDYEEEDPEAEEEDEDLEADEVEATDEEEVDEEDRRPVGEPEEGAEGDEDASSGDEVDDGDLEDDIDSLLEDVASAVEEEGRPLDDLPDPEEPTVDPGPRF